MFRIFRQSQQKAQETQICRYHDHHSMYNQSKVAIQDSLLMSAPKLAFSYYLLPGWKSLTAIQCEAAEEEIARSGISGMLGIPRYHDFSLEY